MSCTIQSLDLSSLRKPRALRPGDSIGIFAPSSPTAQWFPKRFARSVKALAETLEVNVVVSSQAYESTGYTAGNAQRRAAALNELIFDPKINAIFTTIGGFNSAELLPWLDPKAIKENVKIIVGYSDCTALLCGLQTIGGWVTFYGPAVMTQFGEYPHPFPFTVNSFRRVVMDGLTHYQLHDPPGWTDDFLDWAGDEWMRRSRVIHKPASRVAWKPGAGEGYLWGGNIETINFLIGTPYLAIPDNIILFWEATKEEAYLPRVQRALSQFKQAGILARTRAMLVGRSPDCNRLSGTSLRDVTLEAVQEFEFPVIADLPFGHTDPMLTLPLGVNAKVVADNLQPSILVDEPGVQLQSR